MFKYSMIFAATLCIAAPVYATDEQEIVEMRELDRVDTCYYQFCQVLAALKVTDVFSDRYKNLMYVGIALIEVAVKGENGLTDAEKVLWYRQLFDINQEKLAACESEQPSITCLAIKKVLCNKIIECLKAVHTD